MSTCPLETHRRLIPTFTVLVLGSMAVAGPNDYTIDYALGRITGEATLHTGIEATQVLNAQFDATLPIGPSIDFAHASDGFGPFPTEERWVDATGWAVLQIDHPAPNPGYDFAITAQSEVLCNDPSTEGVVLSQMVVDFYVHGSMFLTMHVDATTITENVGSSLAWGRSIVHLDRGETVYFEEHEESSADFPANTNTTTHHSSAVWEGGWFRAEVWALTERTLLDSPGHQTDVFALSRMDIRFSNDNFTSVDFNEDDRVDGRDLALLLAGWGTSDERLDVSRDGTVDGVDLALLMGAWDG